MRKTKPSAGELHQSVLVVPVTGPINRMPVDSVGHVLDIEEILQTYHCIRVISHSVASDPGTVSTSDASEYSS